ncbi:MAG: Omp28-related outer membrane protein [Bacteroidetes bacterium]|nr:Omp28-related outer membrane protein [Bacteroidota bacterium]MDA0904038.1 Omp28-related outer membrane protein [Bacteroidota bacterium]MDA1242720.1 Omp28-related outer membrane protein [Bacteroidota bacterium]
MTLRKDLLLIALAGAVIGMGSCDKLENPVIDILPPCDATTPPEFSVLTSDIQRVLVEDFTAHQCGNCPPAAVKASELAAAHPGQVIPLAIHAGELASTNNEYPTDWTCPEGDVFWDDLEFQVNPVGRVNRLETETSILLLDQWEAKVDALLGVSPVAGLQMVIDHDASSGNTGIHVHTTWFADHEGVVRLSLLVSESHLLGPQLWYGNSPEYVEEYEFEHMLRGSVTGAKGLVVAESPLAGETQQECYAFAWNNAWDAAHCDLLAVLTSDNGSVIQVLSMAVTE